MNVLQAAADWGMPPWTIAPDPDCPNPETVWFLRWLAYQEQVAIQQDPAARQAAFGDEWA